MILSASSLNIEIQASPLPSQTLATIMYLKMEQNKLSGRLSESNLLDLNLSV